MIPLCYSVTFLRFPASPHISNSRSCSSSSNNNNSGDKIPIHCDAEWRGVTLSLPGTATSLLKHKDPIKIYFALMSKQKGDSKVKVVISITFPFP